MPAEHTTQSSHKISITQSKTKQVTSYLVGAPKPLYLNHLARQSSSRRPTSQSAQPHIGMNSPDSSYSGSPPAPSWSPQTAPFRASWTSCPWRQTRVCRGVSRFRVRRLWRDDQRGRRAVEFRRWGIWGSLLRLRVCVVRRLWFLSEELSFASRQRRRPGRYGRNCGEGLTFLDERSILNIWLSLVVEETSQRCSLRKRNFLRWNIAAS